MGYVDIEIKDVASPEDLKKWEDWMLEKAKCQNNFCLGIYGEHELRAVRVIKKGEPNTMYITTLCEDCIKDAATHDVLVNEKHLMIKPIDNFK